MKKFFISIWVIAFIFALSISTAQAQAPKTNDKGATEKKSEVKSSSSPPAPAAATRSGNAGEYKGATFGDPARILENLNRSDSSRNKSANPNKQPAKND